MSTTATSESSWRWKTMTRELDARIAEEVFDAPVCDGLPTRERTRGHNEYRWVCSECGVGWVRWQRVVGEDKPSREEMLERLEEAGVDWYPSGKMSFPIPELDHLAPRPAAGTYRISPFSSNITAAWAVVEEMIDQGWYPNIRPDKGILRIDFCQGDDVEIPTKAGVGGWERIPKEICRAALDALGVEVEEDG